MPEKQQTSESSFEGDEVERRIIQLGKSPYPALVTSALIAANIPRSLRVPFPKGSPSFIGCVAFASIYSFGAYVISQDEENGSGTLTAWSMTYMLLLGIKTLRSRHTLPILATSSVILDTLVYSKRYFGW